MLRMIDPDRALELVLSEAPASGRVASLPVSEALGLTLAEEVHTDRDYPPFDRAMMDGYAVVAADAGKEVTLTGEVAAGQRPGVVVSPGSCVAVMTGAACPPGTEVVVTNEEVTRAGDRVHLPESLVPGRHVSPRGSECRAGSVVARAGTPLTPLAVAVLTTVGCVRVRVLAPPSVAVITTGDELVPADRLPDEVQIRDSNGPMLAALVQRAGLPAPLMLHAEDEMESLAIALQRAASADLVLLSGGVSAGRYDLVPAAIEAFGATPIFHKVTQKPGKPLLFAKRGDQLLFGMPGNPLSGHLCFSRYVVPVVRRIMGRADEPIRQGRLSTTLEVSARRTLFIQARASFEEGEGEARLTPLLGKGSADIFAGLDANAYLRLPPGEHRLQPGAPVSFQRLGE